MGRQRFSQHSRVHTSRPLTMGQTEPRWFEWPFHGTSTGSNGTQELVASQSTGQMSEVLSPSSCRVTRQRAKMVLEVLTSTSDNANVIGMSLLRSRRRKDEEQGLKHRVPGLLAVIEPLLYPRGGAFNNCPPTRPPVINLSAV